MASVNPTSSRFGGPEPIDHGADIGDRAARGMAEL